MDTLREKNLLEALWQSGQATMEDLGINRIGQKTIWCKINLLEELF